MAQCADGFLINCAHLNEIDKFYEIYVRKNKNMFLDDDLWISMYLQIIKKTKIENLIEKFRKETGKNLVYNIHSTVDALSDNIHSPKKFLNRRKIAKIEYIKFKIKNYFISFNQAQKILFKENFFEYFIQLLVNFSFILSFDINKQIIFFERPLKSLTIKPL